MKNKTILFVIAAVTAGYLPCHAQTPSSASETNAAVIETNAAVIAETNAVAIEDSAAVAETNAVPVETGADLAETNAVAGDVPTASAEVDAANDVALNGVNEIVPLIQIDEAPLTDAIKTLARQAGINFQFDPRVLNPTPDATGNVPPQPTVSFRWENVTAMEALMALLENYNLQIVRDTKTRIARITPKDATALEPLLTHVFQLDYANPTNMVTILTNTISSRGRVVADLRTSQLVISATEKELEAVEALIAELDTQTKQILIEARFLEINKNPRSSRGLDWTKTLQEQNITFGNGLSAQAGDALSPLTPPGIVASTAGGFTPNTFFLNAEGVSVALSFLNSDAETESLATPRAVTLENVPTELSVVRNIPIFEEEQGSTSGGSQQASTVKPNYVLLGPGGAFLNEVGIKLMVTPRIFGTSNVFLDLRPEISEKEVEPETTTLGGRVSSSPIFSRRKLQTQAMIPSGYTLVLGGLRQDFNSKSQTKVPILGDIPGLGHVFRSKDKSRDQRDLVIFVTPTIIENGDFQASPESAKFLQRKKVDLNPEDWTGMDSAKPHDWTKPVEGGVQPLHTSQNSTKW